MAMSKLIGCQRLDSICWLVSGIRRVLPGLWKETWVSSPLSITSCTHGYCVAVQRLHFHDTFFSCMCHMTHISVSPWRQAPGVMHSKFAGTASWWTQARSGFSTFGSRSSMLKTELVAPPVLVTLVHQAPWIILANKKGGCKWFTY